MRTYLSQRGVAVGTSTRYQGNDSFGPIPGPYVGEGLLYFIHDTGTDDLGSDRRNLAGREDPRGR